MDTIPTTIPAPAWLRVAGVEGLYQKASTGGFFSRYRLNGRRTFRSLDTDVLTVAKLRHAERRVDIERDRQQGKTIEVTYRTLGDLAGEFLKRVQSSGRAEGTKRLYEDCVDRLRAHWRRGDFNTCAAYTVDHDVIFQLRDHLRDRAPVRLSRRPRAGLAVKTSARGFAPGVVNVTLHVLDAILDIAVEMRTLPANPFRSIPPSRGDVWVPKRRTRVTLPPRATVDAVLAEIRNEWSRRENVDTHLAEYQRDRCAAAADHAEFLAFTGMRLEEANAAQVEDDRGTTLRVRGTKSETSDRFIPVHPALRALLNRLKGDRTTGRLLKADSSIHHLARACKRLGVPRLTHHALRHYFATVCIESGIDIPTVSRFLGHADGGALALKTYGHLRDEHALAMGAKISFAPPPVAPASPQ